MPLTWPINTATPPPGWDVVTDTDGTCPLGWFTRACHGNRAVVRAYPTWDDAPFDIPPELRGSQLNGDLDRLGEHLQGVFDLYYRGYVFPDADLADGPATHSFTNLDFVGGWLPAIGWQQQAEAVVERTIAGLKPASLIAVHDDGEALSLARKARSAGLGVISRRRGPSTRLWIAPAQLADRIDYSTLSAAWTALAAADPNPRLGTIFRDSATAGLSQAFDLDLLEPWAKADGAAPQPWWDNQTDIGLVVLGTVLGYPPASTYALLAECHSEINFSGFRDAAAC